MRKRGLRKVFFISLFIFVTDRIIKNIFRRYLPELTTLNEGVGFGLGKGYNWIWLSVSAAVLVLVVVFIVLEGKVVNLWWSGLFVGAGTANLLDRLAYGGVVDVGIGRPFLQVNLADLVLTADLVILMVHLLTSARRG